MKHKIEALERHLQLEDDAAHEIERLPETTPDQIEARRWFLSLPDAALGRWRKAASRAHTPCLRVPLGHLALILFETVPGLRECVPTGLTRDQATGE